MSHEIPFSRRDQSVVQTVLRSVKRAPVDLLVTLLYVGVVTPLFVLTGPSHELLGRALGLPLVLFLPGYVLLAVFFPGADTEHGGPQRSLPVGERIALSFGMSIALLPLFFLVVESVSTGAPLEAILGVISAFLVFGAILGIVRRLQLPRRRRFSLPVKRWFGDLNRATVGAESPVDGILTIALLLTILLATSTLGFALMVPTDGETYSSFSLLAADGSGEFVASDHPDELVQGEAQQFAVDVENKHSEPITYTVVAELQAVETSGESVTVLGEEELERLQVSVGSGEEERITHTITPSTTGDDLRLQYYLYEGEAPADASTETADRRLFIWIDVAEPE